MGHSCEGDFGRLSSFSLEFLAAAFLQFGEA